MGTTRLGLLLTAIVAVAWMGCGGPETAEPTTAEPTTDTRPPFDTASLEVLGSGYDVTGKYADVSDVKAAVLDVTALANADLLRQMHLERGTFRVVSGENSSEYQRNLAVTAGLEVSAGSPMVGEFSGALKASFKEDRYTNREYSFATVQSIIRKRALLVAQGATPEELRRHLTPAAETALRKSDPAEVFERFGTHVLTGIIVGGRLDLSTSANRSIDKRGRGIDVYARTSFKKKFASAAIEGTIEGELQSDRSWNEYQANEQRSLEVYGGRSEFGQNIMGDEDYGRWIDSVDENVVFMDFAPGGLLGIWELADREARREVLETAWNEYAVGKAITLVDAGTLRSDFEEDDEDWRVIASVIEPAASPQRGGEYGDGYFGRFIYGEDTADSGLIRFRAPPKFRGDKSDYAGGTLQFSLWYRGVDSNAKKAKYGKTVPLVELESANGNLVYRAECEKSCPSEYYPAKPATRGKNDCVTLTTDGKVRNNNKRDYYSGYCRGKPRTYTIPLSTQSHKESCDTCLPEGKWLLWDGREANDRQIEQALASVQELYINGEFVGGTEHTALDRVLMMKPESGTPAAEEPDPSLEAGAG